MPLMHINLFSLKERNKTMIQFKDTRGNRWVFIKANISVIYYTAQDQEGISNVSITTTNDNVYSFAIDWTDADAVRES